MKERPNIVFVMSDQHRRQAMGFWQKEEYRECLNGASDPVKTPNIDRLADEGVVASQAFSSYPVCSPYRAMLFSGLFPEQNGVWHNCAPWRDYELKDEIETFTDVLAGNGYDVGYVGKWHLEAPRPAFNKNGIYVGEDAECEKFFPNGADKDDTDCWDTLIRKDRSRGINYLYMYNTWNVFRANDGTPELSKPHCWDRDYNRITAPDGTWLPEFETELALRYIVNDNNERDAKKPYCLFVSYNPPHLPYNSREDTDYEAYDNYYSPEKKPDYRELLTRPNVSPATENFEDNVRVYFSHVTGIDRQVGRLMDAVDKSGAADNTIFVFTSDHGEMMGSHKLMSKNVIYEESVGIPFIIRYPRRLNHKTDDLLLMGVDIMPTILSLAGVPVPEPTEGSDYSAVLEGSSEKRPKSAFFVQLDTKGVRTDRYVMSVREDTQENYKEPVLFDLKTDPYQMNNLEFSSISADDMMMLRSELGYWLKKSNDPWYQRRLYDNFIIY